MASAPTRLESGCWSRCHTSVQSDERHIILRQREWDGEILFALIIGRSCAFFPFKSCIIGQIEQYLSTLIKLVFTSAVWEILAWCVLYCDAVAWPLSC